jgi:hypothetical protein
LKKPNKDDYILIEVYRPIALLNSIGKILELVMARKLSELIENNDLLPETQIGVRKGRLIETAL